ncbi:MAG TPA: protein kinase [Myxococcales bacterium]|jgi:serine/threonine-protein kinase
MSLRAPEPLVAGARLGEICELLRPVSQGPAGTLWEAQDLQAPRKLSVFVPAADAGAAERLAREAQAASKTGHPGIAQVLSADVLPSGSPVLVLEALPGESLAAKLAKGPLTLDTTLRVGREIASALAAAHREKVVHGRLTGDCVLLCPRESAPEQVKLLGFGLCAPDAEARADVPALAKLVQQMLAEQPLAGGGPDAAQPLEALSGHAPERVIAALRRALDPDPLKRQADVVALMAECSGRAAQAGDGGFMKFAEIEEEATVLKAPERPAAAAPAAAPAPAPSESVAVAERPKAGRGWTIAAALLAIAVAVGTLGFFALKGSGQSPGMGAPPPAEAQPSPGP